MFLFQEKNISNKYKDDNLKSISSFLIIFLCHLQITLNNNYFIFNTFFWLDSNNIFNKFCVFKKFMYYLTLKIIFFKKFPSFFCL